MYETMHCAIALPKYTRNKFLADLKVEGKTKSLSKNIKVGATDSTKLIQAPVIVDSDFVEVKAKGKNKLNNDEVLESRQERRTLMSQNGKNTKRVKTTNANKITDVGHCQRVHIIPGGVVMSIMRKCYNNCQGVHISIVENT